MRVYFLLFKFYLFLQMKTINLRGVINPLSDSEMKNVKGGKEVIEGPPL